MTGSAPWSRHARRCGRPSNPLSPTTWSIAPTRASLAPAVAARAVPAATVVNRPIVAATAPPARVASFAQRQAVLDKNPGRPLSEHTARTKWPTLLNPLTYRGMWRLGSVAARVVSGRVLNRRPL